MKITFLGTSAGESYPAIWCDCENCAYARAHGGRNLRMNTGTMIDSDILLDMNSCGFYTAARLGVSLTGVTRLLVTHPHADHLTVEPLAWRQEAAGASDAAADEQRAMVSPRFTRLPMLTVYGNRFAREALADAHPELFDGSARAQMRFQEIREGERVELDDLAFTPVRANHTPQRGFAHSYILERGRQDAAVRAGHRRLRPRYARPDPLAALRRRGHGGHVRPERAPSDGHMNREKNVAFRNLLLERGCIGADTRSSSPTSARTGRRPTTSTRR